jgi:hypothetical protein
MGRPKHQYKPCSGNPPTNFVEHLERIKRAAEEPSLGGKIEAVDIRWGYGTGAQLILEVAPDSEHEIASFFEELRTNPDIRLTVLDSDAALTVQERQELTDPPRQA